MIKKIRQILLLLICFMPMVAYAHSPIKGMGDFFNGVIHPLLVPEQVLTILALGFLLGQHQPSKHKVIVLLFLAATIAGLVTTFFEFNIGLSISTLLLTSAVIIGLIVVISIRVPLFIFIIVAVAVGFIIGLDSTAGQFSNKGKIIALFGSGVGIYFLLLYAMAVSESFSVKHWQKIAVRVFSSWVSASALMVLALSLSNKI